MKKGTRKQPDLPTTAILQFADTERNADQFYFGGFQAPDPFISMGIGNEKIGFFSRLEIGRAMRESAFDTILSLEEWIGRARNGFGAASGHTAGVIRMFCRERKVSRLEVGAEFPAGLAFDLQTCGLKIDIVPGMLFPAREFKSDREAKLIAEGNRCSAAGIRAAERILRTSRIEGRHLLYEGRRLTSERLRLEIEQACLERGAVSLNTIAAGGAQACDPHCRGSGILRPHELIIIDVFPQVTETGYHGDMTRTFLKGRASEAQKKLVAAVRDGHRIGLETIKAGVSGNRIHRDIVALFESRGFRTEERAGGPVGFFHGTGHGLGLEVHEPPRIAAGRPRLRRNQVVTVEPGLYYPEIGGCRFEDVVRVKADGVEMLSKLHYRWQIR
ncbi:MAG: aminopeptidase P family protein [Verrucomicrobia bacterium]|nr:MAG: aminopeptidase P family protein [Verrucomicrobiota bacterium]